MDDDLRALIDHDAVLAHRDRALTPDAPKIRGTAQNPDELFQAREAGNLFYQELPGIVKEAMRVFGKRTGRFYQPFGYEGAPDFVKRVTVLMLAGKGENLMKLDSAAPKATPAEFTGNETRFQMLQRIDPERAAMLQHMAAESVKERFAFYQQMAATKEHRHRGMISTPHQNQANEPGNHLSRPQAEKPADARGLAVG
ncbi:MAG: hypothetical protein ACO3JG_12450 [Luteolibacter sp.]